MTKKVIKVISLILFSAILIYFTIGRNYFTFQRLRINLIHNKTAPMYIEASKDLKRQLQKLVFTSEYVRSDKDRKLIVVLFEDGLGDRFTAHRLRMAAENLGWNTVVIGYLNSDNQTNKRMLLKDQIITALKPDFVISQYPVGIVQGIPHYIALHSLDENIIDVIEERKEALFSKYLPYDGMLGAFGDDRYMKLINEVFTAHGKELHYIPFYHSVSALNNGFRRLDYHRLFFSGARWDSLRRGGHYAQLYAALDQKGYLDLYGLERDWHDYPNSYRGFLPYDVETFLNAMRQSGVTLILNSNHHYANNMVSSRVFEAAASSTVIISDELPFIKENFGDSVLYIDISKSPEEIFSQIDQHMQWIQTHHQEAQAKARKANQIFREKYTLEKQLLQLDALNQRLSKSRVKDLNSSDS